MSVNIKCTFFICVSAALLAACNDQASTSSLPPQASEPERVVETLAPKPKEGEIYFADGTGVAFDGKVLREERLENANGTFQRYVLQVPAGLMALEVSTFDVLARAGYVRQVRKEEPSLFSVSYSKKGSPGILAAYRELKPGKDGKPRTQLVLTWRIAQ